MVIKNEAVESLVLAGPFPEENKDKEGALKLR